MFKAIFQDRKTGQSFISSTARTMDDWFPYSEAEGVLSVCGNRPWDNSQLQIVGFQAAA